MPEATRNLIEEQNDDAKTFPTHPEITDLIMLITNSCPFSKVNKEVFLCELISNASHALDEIKYESITDSSKLGNCKDLCIKILPNKDDRTLTIIDNGIGMTKADLIKNPGNIAKTGTKAFMNSLQMLIGSVTINQFEYLNNAGFYSAFLVADKVTVTSKHNDDEQYMWESSADGTFTIRRDHGEPLGRGTKIVLCLKEDQQIFLAESKIKEIIKNNSHLIGYPIKLFQKEMETEVTDDEAEEQTDDQQGWFSTGFFGLFKTKSLLDEPKVEDKKKKKIKKYTEGEQLNNTEPLWMRNPDNINQEEYGHFYESLTNKSNGYLAVKHFSVEGQLKFRALLFVSKEEECFDYFLNKSIKLYVHGIFFMASEYLKTDYLNFIHGVVEFEDLPLNISKEMLLQNKILLEDVRKNLEGKCLELFDELAKDKDIYRKFYKQYSNNLKKGIISGSTSSQKIAECLRFYTSLSGDEYCSLRDYVSRMKENQKSIYFIIGNNKHHVANSLFLERLTKRGFEVIYMTESIDDHLVKHLKEYDGKTLMSVMKEGFELPEDEEAKKKFEENKVKFENLCNIMKNILDKTVKKVVITSRLESSPCCIISDQCGYNSRRNSLRISEKKNKDINKYLLEINPNHPVIENLRQKADTDKNDESVKEHVMLLYETAVDASGYFVENPHTFASLIYRNIERSLGIHKEKLAGANAEAA